ncbi:MAG TPA: Fur family transcriptional regulator [Desulfobulbaceae bacterium]|nr:Fur family transcriptional regulator [Desulfobulbaceae bacterium]
MQKLLRMTHQREIILDEMKKCNTHPTADELYERIKKKLPRISLATVYRNLEIMSESGLINKLEISGRQKRFDWELQQHDHIYCVQCHRVDNIDLAEKKNIPLPEQENHGYIVSGCRVEFYGICPKCQSLLLRTKKRKGKKMACKSKCGTKGLSDKQRTVLEAMAKCEQACGSKDIAAATGLEPKQVSCQITALKKKGFVESPVRCKYTITGDGKSAIA